jgi:putative membrane protein
MMAFGVKTLSAEEREAVEGAIRAAEAVTSAEIVVVVDRIAGSWRSWAMVVALLLALAAPWPLIELTQFATRTIFTLQLLTAAGLIALFMPQAARLRLVPPMLRRRKGHEAALREFTARNLSATRARNGMLIYVALAERYAEIVADAGIKAVVDDGVWKDAMERLIADVDRGALGNGLTEAVNAAARALAAPFPPRADDADEIENKVIVL